MNTLKEKGKNLLQLIKLLRIRGFLLVVLVLFCACALYYVFQHENTSQVIATLVYLFSAYVLCNLVISITMLTIEIREWIYAHKYIYRLLYDAEYRMHYSVYLSLGMTIIMAGIKLGISLFSLSLWFVAVASYSIVMGMARFVIFKNHRKVLRLELDAERYQHEALTYKKCGTLLIFFTITLCAAVWQMIFYDKGTSYPGLLIYAIAAYTFYCMGIAIKNMIKSRKTKNLILVSIRYLEYANALVSMLMLQTAMFAAFGGDGIYNRWMNAISGVVVCMIILIMGIQMIKKANRILRKQS